MASTEQTRKASPAKDTFKKWLPSFRLISILIGNAVSWNENEILWLRHFFASKFKCIRFRVVTLVSIKKLFKLFSNIKLLIEFQTEQNKSSSLTEIISCISQTLDAFVRARDLLELFSEVLLNDLLPLCSQLLTSSNNIDEFSLLALCIVDELLNELKLNDCVLPEHLQRDIRHEFEQTFLPIITERHLLRTEPIAVLSLRFIQNLWLMKGPTAISSTILSQSKLIPNLFSLILVKEKFSLENFFDKQKLFLFFSKTKINRLERSFKLLFLVFTHYRINVNWSRRWSKMVRKFSFSFDNEKRHRSFRFGFCRITINSRTNEFSQRWSNDGQLASRTSIVTRSRLDLCSGRCEKSASSSSLSRTSWKHVELSFQVKKTGAGDTELPSVAEKLLQAHKPLVGLVGPLIALVCSIENWHKSIVLSFSVVSRRFVDLSKCSAQFVSLNSTDRWRRQSNFNQNSLSYSEVWFESIKVNERISLFVSVPLWKQLTQRNRNYFYAPSSVCWLEINEVWIWFVRARITNWFKLYNSWKNPLRKLSWRMNDVV